MFSTEDTMDLICWRLPPNCRGWSGAQVELVLPVTRKSGYYHSKLFTFYIFRIKKLFSFDEVLLKRGSTSQTQFQVHLSLCLSTPIRAWAWAWEVYSILYLLYYLLSRSLLSPFLVIFKQNIHFLMDYLWDCIASKSHSAEFEAYQHYLLGFFLSFCWYVGQKKR